MELLVDWERSENKSESSGSGMGVGMGEGVGVGGSEWEREFFSAFRLGR